MLIAENSGTFNVLAIYKKEITLSHTKDDEYTGKWHSVKIYWILIPPPRQGGILAHWNVPRLNDEDDDIIAPLNPYSSCMYKWHGRSGVIFNIFNKSVSEYMNSCYSLWWKIHSYNIDISNTALYIKKQLGLLRQLIGCNRTFVNGPQHSATTETSSM